MTKKLNHLLTLSCVLLIMMSCKNDTELPTLQVTTPDNMSSYSFNETINIKGSAQDDKNLKYVKAEIFNANMEPMGISESVNLSGDTDDFTLNLALGNKQMENGSYIIKIAVYDKSDNHKSDFINIQYSGLVKQLLNILAVNKIGSSSFTISDLATNGVFTKNFSGDYHACVSNPEDEILLISGADNGDLIGYDITSDEVLWQKTADTYHSPHYNSSTLTSYYCVNDDKLVSLNRSGSFTSTIILSSNETLQSAKTVFESNNIITYSSIFNGNRISHIYKNSGQRANFKDIIIPPVSILPINDNEAWLLCSNGLSCKLYRYYLEENSLVEPENLPDGNINDAVLIDDEIYIAHSTGLLKYTPQNTSLVTINSNMFSKLEVESMSNTLYAVNGSNVTILDEWGNNLGTLSSTNLIHDLILHYNK